MLEASLASKAEALAAAEDALAGERARGAQIMAALAGEKAAGEAQCARLAAQLSDAQVRGKHTGIGSGTADLLIEFADDM